MTASLSALAALLAVSTPVPTDSFQFSSFPSIHVSSRRHGNKLFASGGMDAYAAQIAALSANAAAPTPSPTPSPPSPASTSSTSSSFSGTATASSAIASLSASQSQILSRIASSIPDLAPKHDLSYDASSGLIVHGFPVILDARDAPGPSNIAWLSSLCIENTLSSFTVFNGPLTDVPHLLSRCAVDHERDRMRFFLDFRPRAYGAYEMRKPDGTYPGPDVLGRKSFEYSGNRRQFDDKFGTPEVISFLDGVVDSLEGCVRLGQDIDSLGELERVTRGPLALDVLVPISPRHVDAHHHLSLFAHPWLCYEIKHSQHNIHTILRARETAANYWLTWALDPAHAHRPGAPINSQYVYDTKYKQNAYGALLNFYRGLYGQVDGEKLAVADSGPLDEAYVGGGS
ncbi:hypothetical protein ACHAWX_007189 [Stephanocyclus meneghinianus]